MSRSLRTAALVLTVSGLAVPAAAQSPGPNPGTPTNPGAATSPNAAPAVLDDTAETTAGLAVVIDVLANDADPDGDALTIVSVSAPSNGTATTDGAAVTYTPAPGFDGTDGFTYTVSDGRTTSSGTVQVAVRPANRAPEAPMITSPTSGSTLDLSTTSGAVAIEWTAGDPDGDALAFRWELAADAAFETVVLSAEASGPSLSLTAADVASALDAAGVRAGATVYHRVTADDGQLETVGLASALVVDLGPATAAGDGPEGEPSLAVWPNPSAGRVTVALAGLDGDVRVAIYDVLGREVAVLRSDARGVGEMRLVLDEGSLRPGLYVVRAEGSVTSLRAPFVVR